MLEKLQYIIEKSIRDNREKYDSLLSSLENVLSIVNNNRNELKAPVVQEEEEAVDNAPDQPEDSTDDYGYEEEFEDEDILE